MALGDSDLGVFFQDGVKVVLPNGTSAMANLDWPENVDFLRGQLTSGAVVAKPTITYATDSLGLMSDMPITVDGRHTPWMVSPGASETAKSRSRS
jgi:hypothetical protein